MLLSVTKYVSSSKPLLIVLCGFSITDVKQIDQGYCYGKLQVKS